MILNRDGVFKYTDSNQEVGDYLEAEFIADLGVVNTFLGPNYRPVPVLGFELLITLSANYEEPRRVIFKTANLRCARLFMGRKPGEKLVLKTVWRKTRYHTWPELVVNGEMIGLNGSRVKA